MSGITSTSASAQAKPDTRYGFAYVKSSSPHFSDVVEIFSKYIIPFYGNQDAALNKIRDRTDRRCELLLQDDSHIVGLIVYKTELQQEHSQAGLTDSFEVKSLFAMGVDSESQKAHRTMLLNRVIKLAQRKFSKSVHLTVSERSQDLMDFFTEKGFNIGATWQDRYLQGVKEHLIYLRLAEKKSGKIAESTTTTEAPSRKEPEGSPDSGLKRKRDREENEPRRKEARPDDQRSSHHTSPHDRNRSVSHQGRNSRPSSFSTDRASSSSRASTGNRFHELTLKPKYVHQIQSGRKTIEGRIKSGMILQFKPGDTIRFFYHQNQSDDAVCHILAIRPYGSFRDMLEKEGFEKCLTDVRDLKTAVRVYDQIPNYAARAAASGVVAIQLQLKQG